MEDNCSYGYNSLMGKVFDLNELSKDAENMGEAMLVELNPFGFFS